MEAYVKAHPQRYFFRQKTDFRLEFRVFDLDGITNRCEELLPGWDIGMVYMKKLQKQFLLMLNQIESKLRT